jgi:L-alanine-DL-glutamate epimerase-like enolase superfamily enzyme
MERYYMTSHNPNEISFWWPCTATTLSAAKAEARREYGGGFRAAELQIATGDGVTEQRRVIATRRNVPGARWQDR